MRTLNAQQGPRAQFYVDAFESGERGCGPLVHRWTNEFLIRAMGDSGWMGAVPQGAPIGGEGVQMGAMGPFTCCARDA